jgi:hypothetical protein
MQRRHGDFTIEGTAVNFELTLIFLQSAIGYNQGLFGSTQQGNFYEG